MKKGIEFHWDRPAISFRANGQRTRFFQRFDRPLYVVG